MTQTTLLKRRTLLRRLTQTAAATAVMTLLFCLVCHEVNAQTVPPPAAADIPSAEPTYTLVLPDGQKLNLFLKTARSPDGGGTTVVQVGTRSLSAAAAAPSAPPALRFDTTLLCDAQAAPVRCQAFLGVNPGVGLTLEAVRQKEGSGFVVRAPAQNGNLAFGGTLFAPLLSELFIGRWYDFTRGGEQTFAMMAEEGLAGAVMVTLKLTADGTETIELAEGPVKARKLRYRAPIPNLPKEQQIGLIYVGPQGELLRCDTAFFGIPLKTKGPARWENDGKRFSVRFGDDKPGAPVVLLRADRAPRVGSTAPGWTMTLEIENGITLATGACDAQFRMTRLETPWHIGKFTAEVRGQTVQYHVEPGPSTLVAAPSGNPFFVPHWFVTDLWEERPAGLSVGETRVFDYLPLFTGDPNGGGPMTLERLPDVVASSNGGVSLPAVRHYRTVSNGGGDKTTPGKPLPTYELYTDGRRMLAFLGSDGIVMRRDGWEAWAAALPKPAAVR